MFDIIYVEEAIKDHLTVLSIQRRFHESQVVYCNQYTEVFNRTQQNFRLQKQNPCLILAKKEGHFVLPIPEGYGIGTQYNYYFSHMLNCLYDCRYCFLQGLYQSAHLVLFVNLEAYEKAIVKILAQHPNEPVTFFSGYDCDSLGFENVSQFIQHFLPFFQKHPLAILEVRTKSPLTRPFLEHSVLPNVVIAYSLTPPKIHEAVEHKTPSLASRLQAMQTLQKKGWHIGLRFDPIIYTPDFESLYTHFFEQIFSILDPLKIHSVSFGLFRLPKPFYKKLAHLYPEDPLIQSDFLIRKNTVSYSADIEKKVVDFCMQSLKQYIAEKTLFPCSVDI